jgi:hypothetical protein
MWPYNFQVILDMMDCRFGFINEIRTKNSILSWLNPIERCTASTPIQCLKRCHLEALLIAIVIWELSPWQILVPAALVFHHAGSKHIMQNLIHSLYLAIHLWVIGWTVDQVSSKGSMQLFLEASNKLWPESEMIIFGTPCRQRMRAIEISAYFSTVKLVCMGIKWADLVKRSTITHIESTLWVVGCKPTMKSMLMSSHFQSKIEVVTILPASCSWLWPFYSYCIHTHSELSCTSFVSTRIVALDCDTSWCSRGEWSTSMYELRPIFFSWVLLTLAPQVDPWTIRFLPHPRGNSWPVGHLLTIFSSDVP